MCYNPSMKLIILYGPPAAGKYTIAKALSATSVSVESFVSLISESNGATQSLPLIGFAEAGASGYFDDGGFPVGRGWDEVSLPQVTDENAYALKVNGDSMRPVYRAGDVIVVSPGAPVRKGDRVVVKTRRGEVMVKELRKKSPKSVELKSLNTAHGDRHIAMQDVDWIARIIWATQ